MQHAKISTGVIYPDPRLRGGQSLILFSEYILKQLYSTAAMQDSIKFPGVLGW